MRVEVSSWRQSRVRIALVLTFAVLAASCASDSPAGTRGEIAVPAASTTASPPTPTMVPPTQTAVPTTAVPTTGAATTGVSPTAVAATAIPPTAIPPTPTTAPTLTATVTPTEVPKPTGPCRAGSLAEPDPNRPVYDVSLTIDVAAGAVQGDMRVRFTPDLATDKIVLRLWPNSPRHLARGGALTLTDVLVDGSPNEPSLGDPTTATIALDTLLQAGEQVEVAASFELALPGEGRSRLSHAADYQRLGSIIPLVAWEPGRGWAEDAPTSLFAESVSSPVADWNVEISISEGYDLLASGVNDGTGVWRLQSGRDFAISVGRFRSFSGTAFAPDPVAVSVGVHDTVPDDGQAYLDKIIDSLEQFSERWGAYPWPSLTFAITPNLAGGIEFPTHIMQGPNTIGRTTSHEVGHMFFYSLVGNNQGSAPWLDEGLTSYAEFTYEGTAPGAYEIPAAGQGLATQPMSWWESRGDLYYRSVYSQTGFALQRLADQETVDCALADYVAANAHRIATAEDFIDAFEPWIPTVREDLAALGVAITAAD